jgi:hypothetical protein
MSFAPRSKLCTLLVPLLSAGVLVGCEADTDGSDATTDGDADGDTDADADADSDGSVDGDADAAGDADVDEETDADVEAVCPEGYDLGDFYGKPVVEVTVNGSGPYLFVYDTGAPGSLVDDDLAEEIGDAPYTVTVADRTVSDVAFYITDVDAMLGGPSEIDGLVGTNVMGRFAVTLDRQRQRFWLDDEPDEASLGACAHVVGDPRTMEFVEDDYLFVQGRAELTSGWFLLDTGASLGAMPESTFEILQSAHERPTVQGFYTQAAVGTFWADLTAVGFHEVSGLRVDHIVTRTMDDDMIPVPEFPDGGIFLGVLPNPFLRHFLITVDYPRDQLRLDPYAGDEMREPATFYALGIGIAENLRPPVRVAEVLSGSSAEEQGVQEDDEIVSIGPYEMADLRPAEWGWMLVSDEAGVQADVVLRRDGELIEVTLETRDLLTDPVIDE